MKNYLSILFITIIGLTFASSATAKNSAEEYQVFRIHIGAFVKAKLTDFNRIRPYGYLYAEKFDNNILQVYMGEYETDPAAKQVLRFIKANGFPDAYVTRRTIKNGRDQVMIQLGVSGTGEDINWRHFSAAGSLYTHLTRKQAKILTGPFASATAAKNRLAILKKNGFPDAFVKTVNNKLLHQVTSFETGDLDAVAVMIEGSASDVKIPKDRPTDYETTASAAPKNERPAADIPKPYDFVARSGSSDQIPLPSIRKNVKRTSVLELQKVLKEAKAYTGSLDGLYGSGTTKGVAIAPDKIPQLKKYNLLSKFSDETNASTIKVSSLQANINGLLDHTAAAMSSLKASKEPIAKAYRAYVLFRQNGQNTEVDNLMNVAIQQAFVGKTLKNAPKFDYKATYTYKDLDQLILHLSYIQRTTNKVATPCWLFQEHAKESANAFSSGANYTVQDCNPFLNWEEMKLLETIVEDLNPDPNNKINAATAAKASAKRSRLFLAPKALSPEELNSVKSWNINLWKGIETWIKKDPLHKKLSSPLKFAYYQTQVRLEDYYMDKGFSSREATGLSLAVLKSLVDQHLINYY